MPALTSSRVGSSAISDADGTTVWPRSSKKRRNRRRISADLIAPTSLLLPVVEVRCVEPQRLAQLVLALRGVRLHLCPPCGDPVAGSSSLRGEPLRRPLVCRCGHPAYDEHARRSAERDVEQPSHRPLA